MSSSAYLVCFRPLALFMSFCRDLPDDGEWHVETYNSELARLAEQGKNTWFTAPWLFAEQVNHESSLFPVADFVAWM